jgi:peptide chain release factor 2
LKRLGGGFDVDHKRLRISEIENQEAQESFWVDQKNAQNILKEKALLQGSVDKVNQAKQKLDDTFALIELVELEPTQENVREVAQEADSLEKQIRAMELAQMLSGPNDSADAFVSINAGAGGTEAQDWAQMLMRMYVRYSEDQGFKVSLVDQLPGEEAGIKSVTFLVQGPYAFGLLGAENGVHRLVRISPFDANKRRHTSFASVFVYPDIEKDIEIEVLDKDLRVDTFRAGGAGGQHVNKTDSAVRLTHIPSGIVVSSQNERSQHQNRAMAMKILKARLFDRELEKRNQEKKAVEDSKMDIAWGSQIRSYVLAPYRLCKDHRTDFEVGDVLTVLEGKLQPFIEYYLLNKGAK